MGATRHVDMYRAAATDPPDYPHKLLAKVYVEAQWPAEVRESGGPYWNGYYYATAPHDDGECEEHRP